MSTTTASPTEQRATASGNTRLLDQVEDMKMQLEQLQDDAAYQARRLARQARQAMRDHPWQTIAIAAAAGALAGALAMRRRG